MPERVANPLLNSFLLGAALVVTVGVVIWMASGEPETADEPEAPAAGSAEADVSPEAEAFDLGPFAFDAARLEAEWEAERAANPLEVGPDEEQLMEAFWATNEQTAGGDDETRMMALHDRFVVDVQRYVVSHGPRQFRAVGWLLVERFHHALAEVRARARERAVPAWEVLADTDSEARSWRQRLGNFFSMARRADLVDERGQPLVDDALLTVLFRYRWLNFAEDYASPVLMTPYERVVLWRWRIEAAAALPLQQRLALLDEIEDVYDGPMAPDAVRAVLYYREGDLERTRAYLRRVTARYPDDERYRRLLAALDAADRARP